MTNVQAIPPRGMPRVTFSVLVDVLANPTHRLVPILHPQKYPEPGPVFGYKKAVEQLVRWFHDGTVPNALARGLRAHEKTALLKAVAVPGSPKSLLPRGVNDIAFPGTVPPLTINGVEISFFPDLLVSKQVGKKTAAHGAVKLYLRKQPLQSGPEMAALLFFHRSQVAGDQTADPNLCAVTDVQAGVVYTATGNYQRLLGQIEQACQVIAAVWPTV